MIRLPDSRAGQSSLLPDLTPLLDVIFIVLVFFLLTAQTPLLQLPLELPDSREALKPASVTPGDRLQVALDAEGRWRLADEPMTDFPALRQALLASLATTEKPGLDLALDRHAPLSAFLDLMALLQQQGLDDTRILMEPSPDAP